MRPDCASACPSRAASSAPLTACSRMWATRSCGCCATCAQERCSWRAACWVRRKGTWCRCWRRSVTALAGSDGERREDAIPLLGVISDGQHSLRKAVARALPGVPHQLCQFHYLREAARPIFEADRHAKKELKKR